MQSQQKTKTKLRKEEENERESERERTFHKLCCHKNNKNRNPPRLGHCYRNKQQNSKWTMVEWSPFFTTKAKSGGTT